MPSVVEIRLITGLIKEDDDCVRPHITLIEKGLFKKSSAVCWFDVRRTNVYLIESIF